MNKSKIQARGKANLFVQGKSENFGHIICHHLFHHADAFLNKENAHLKANLLQVTGRMAKNEGIWHADELLNIKLTHLASLNGVIQSKNQAYFQINQWENSSFVKIKNKGQLFIGSLDNTGNIQSSFFMMSILNKSFNRGTIEGLSLYFNIKKTTRY